MTIPNLVTKIQHKQYTAPYLKGNIEVSGGTVYFNFLDGSRFRTYPGDCMDINYDVNGASKHNQTGRDIFMFVYCPSMYGYCDGKGGFCTYRVPSMNTREKRLQRCRENASWCASLLEMDNWEFAKDYPWLK